MSELVTFNNATYIIPDVGESNYGQNLTNYFVALANGSYQLSGGTAPLTAPLSFGPNFGISTINLTSISTHPALTGVIRLANTDPISWRNAANGADLPLTVNGSNQLTFNGVPIAASSSLTDNHIYVGNALNQPADVAMSGDVSIVASGTTTIANSAITDAKVNASAAIALSKLASLTASKALVSDGSGIIAASSVTNTELGYVSGVTSPIQTQLTNITGTLLPTYLPLAGGTMSGSINMASNKITSLMQGTNSGDAVAKSQLVILQQVRQSVTSGVSESAGMSVDTGLTATITPLYSTSIIRITYYHHGLCNAGASSNPCQMGMYLIRDSTQINYDAYALGIQNNGSGVSTDKVWGTIHGVVFDVVSDTNPHVYKTQIINAQPAGTVSTTDTTIGRGWMILEEIQ